MVGARVRAVPDGKSDWVENSKHLLRVKQRRRRRRPRSRRVSPNVSYHAI